jgi:hypothetical protein
MYQARIGDALHALWRQNVQDALTGSYVESGLNASPGSSGSSIQVDVDPGDVRIDDSPTSVAGDTLTFDAVGTSDEYRADVIYATASGGLAVEKGNSATPEPTISDGDPYPSGTPQPARRLFAPSPPDGSSINGLPIHVVMIADTMSDSNDLALEDLVDYRISPPLPGEHDHPDLALNQRTVALEGLASRQFVKLATISDGTVSSGAMRVEAYRANAEPQEDPRSLDVEIVSGGDNVRIDARSCGSRTDGGTPGTTDVLVTEEDSSTNATKFNRYHLYVNAPEDCRTYLKLSHIGPAFGGYQYITGLGQNDLLGTTVHDTGDPTNGGEGHVLSPKTVGTVGDLPVRDGDGNADWATRQYRTGEYEPLASFRFGADDFSTTNNSFNNVTTLNETVLFDRDDFTHPMFESPLYANLAGRISCDSEGETATVRLLLGESAINDSSFNQKGNTFSQQSGPIAQLPDVGAVQQFHIQMKCTGGATARIRAPTMTLYGRMGGV